MTKLMEQSFRPQQGLTIMNSNICGAYHRHPFMGFRPQQGLTIMNKQLKAEGYFE